MDQGFFVHGVVERLTHTHVGHRVGRSVQELGTIVHQDVIDLGRREELHVDVGIGLQFTHTTQGDELGGVEFAGLEFQDTGGVFGDDLEAHTIQVGQLHAVGVGLPVVGIAFHHHVRTAHPFFEHERTGPDWLLGEGLGLFLVCLTGGRLEERLRHDGAVEHGQRGRDGRVWAVQIEDNLVVADRFDRIDGFKREVPDAVLRVARPVQGPDNIVNRDVRAIGELDTVAQGDSVGKGVLGGFVARRQHRLDTRAVLGGLEERIVEAVEHPDVQVGIVEHRVQEEGIGIAAKDDVAAGLAGFGLRGGSGIGSRGGLTFAGRGSRRSRCATATDQQRQDQDQAQNQSGSFVDGFHVQSSPIVVERQTGYFCNE